MQTIPDLVRKKLIELIRNRGDLIRIACQQRAKFEGWLKFELAVALAEDPQISQVAVEVGYSQGGRSDISFFHGAEQWFVELKTTNTNWRVKGVEDRHRPITKNVNAIIDDIHMLQEKSPPARGLVVFIVFPVPVAIWNGDREKLAAHLKRIEQETSIPTGHFLGLAEFLPLTDRFGLCIFVDEISP